MPKTRPTTKRTKTTRRQRVRKVMKTCTEDIRVARELAEEANRLTATIARYPLIIWVILHAITTGGDTLGKMLVIAQRLLGTE